MQKSQKWIFKNDDCPVCEQPINETFKRHEIHNYWTNQRNMTMLLMTYNQK